MAAVLRRTEVGVREIGTTVTIPEDNTARLMYYLECMCLVLDLNNEENMDRLTKYSRYYSLTQSETDALITLCFLFSPDVLAGKVIFLDDTLCGDSSNTFYELNAVQHNMLVSDNILIAGQQRAVHKVMFYKHQWIQSYWIDPMQSFAARLGIIASRGRNEPQQRITYGTNMYPTTPMRQDSDCCCCIL